MNVNGLGSYNSVQNMTNKVLTRTETGEEVTFSLDIVGNSSTKTDTVELNSSSLKNADAMTIYRMLASEHPGVNFILKESNGYDFYNGINTKIGDTFGKMDSKSVYIDISVIEKIQENPSNYNKAKSALNLLIQDYDDIHAAETKEGRPYTVGMLEFEDGRITASYISDSIGYEDAVARAESKLDPSKYLEEKYLEEVDKVKNEMLDKYMEAISQGAQ